MALGADGRRSDAAAVAAYTAYAERFRGWVSTGPEGLAPGWRAAFLASWVPPWRSRPKEVQHTLCVLGADGALSAAVETTPGPVSPDQARSLLRLVMRREGPAADGAAARLLPPALRAYAREIGGEVAQAATRFTDDARPVTGVETAVARCEYRRRAVDMWRFLRLLDPEIVSVLIQTQAAEVGDYAHYQAPKTRLHRLQAARAYPLLAPVIARTAELRETVDAGRPLLPALAAHFQVPEKLIRRLTGVSWRDLPLNAPRIPDQAALESLVHDLAALEPGTLPRRRRDWVPLLALRNAARPFHTNVAHRGGDRPLHVLAQPKWAEMAERMLAEGLGDRAPRAGSTEAIRRLELLSTDACDVVDAVYRNFVLPIAVLVAAERRGGRPAIVRAELERRPPAAAHALASEMAYGALTPPKILRRSRECHARPELFQTFGRDLAWEPLFERREAPNGVVIRPLVTSAELKAEGAGMRHCVGGYGHACAYEGRHILGLRTPTGERLSTAEIARPEHARHFVVRQHRGVANNTPPAVAASALVWLREEIEGGELKLDVKALNAAMARREARRRYMEGSGEEAQFAVYQALAMWRPYLEKPWSKLDFPTLMDAVARRALAWT